jgi:putative acetyltransferase
MPPSYTILPDDLSSAQTRALLALHLSGMHESSPPGTVSALDLSGLQTPDMTVWTAWHGDQIAAIAALKRLNSTHGELKSMRTHPAYLRRGAARALLAHIITQARAGGLTQLSLETGSGAAFTPAHTLYLAHGFNPGPPFADYPENGFSHFFHLQLT